MKLQQSNKKHNSNVTNTNKTTKQTQATHQSDKPPSVRQETRAQQTHDVLVVELLEEEHLNLHTCEIQRATVTC